MTLRDLPGQTEGAAHVHDGSQISGVARLISIYKRQLIDALVEADITDLDHYTDTDANSAIDTRVDKAFVEALTIDIVEAQITDLDHTDDTAIHDNVSGEISAVTEKTTPVVADLVLIEDSAASNAKKRVQLSNLGIAIDPQVRAATQDLTGSTISTTATVEMSSNLAVPASWATYQIYAWMQGRLFESGTLTGIRLVTHELRLTDATGTRIGQVHQVIGTDTPDNQGPFAVNGVALSQTATGTVTVCYVASIPADSAQTSWDDGTLLVAAYRTS